MKPIRFDKTILNAVEVAIRKAPKKKATGADEIFFEALQANPQSAADIIYQLCVKSCKFKHVLNDCATAKFDPSTRKESGTRLSLTTRSHLYNTFENQLRQR